MSASYNNSAWFYNALSRLVYGKALIKAQVYLVQFIQPDSKILIVGGGTGWILEELTKIYPAGLEITYCEIAPKMMARSKKKDTGTNKVLFINEAVEQVEFTRDFDVILTPFLFDNFTQQTLQKVFQHLHKTLKPGGLWLNCDFQLAGKWWQGVLLKSMFWFFRLICGIEASKLPEIKEVFLQNGCCLLEKKTFYGDFILSEIYVKP